MSTAADDPTRERGELQALREAIPREAINAKVFEVLTVFESQLAEYRKTAPANVIFSRAAEVGRSYYDPVQALATKEKELEDLRIQVERLKTLSTAERRVASYERQRYEELLGKYDELLEEMNAQREMFARLEQGVKGMASQLLNQRELAYHRYDSLTRTFYTLAALWKIETIHVSNVSQKCSHPAYQQIIGMGAAVLPLIFLELEEEPDDWFVALRAITGVDPVSPQSRGNLQEVLNAWLGWAKDNHYCGRDSSEERLSSSRLEDFQEVERRDG